MMQRGWRILQKRNRVTLSTRHHSFLHSHFFPFHRSLHLKPLQSYPSIINPFVSSLSLNSVTPITPLQPLHSSKTISPIISNIQRQYATLSKELLVQMRDLNIQGQEYTKLGLYKEAINSYKAAINILKQRYSKKQPTTNYNLMEDNEEDETESPEVYHDGPRNYSEDNMKNNMNKLNLQNLFNNSKNNRTSREEEIEDTEDNMNNVLNVVHEEKKKLEENRDELDEFVEELDELNEDENEEDSIFFVRETTFDEVLQAELNMSDDLKVLLSRTNFSDTNFAVLFCNLAVVYIKAMDTLTEGEDERNQLFHDVKGLLLRGLFIRTQSEGVYSLSVANIKNHLGLLYRSFSLFLPAIDSYFDAVKIMELHLEPNDLQIANAFTNLAICFHERALRSAKILKRRVDKYNEEKALEEERIQKLERERHLAILKFNDDNNNNNTINNNKNQKIDENVNIDSCNNTQKTKEEKDSNSENNINNVENEEEEIDEDEEMKDFGDEGYYDEENDIQQAESLFLRAKTIYFENNFATAHDQVKGLKNLGLFYSQHNKYEEASKYVSELIELRNNEIPHPIELANDMKLYAKCLVKLKRPIEAIDILKEALDLLDRKHAKLTIEIEEEISKIMESEI